METEFKDLDVKCKDCSELFTITAGEQEFYKNHLLEDGTNMTMPKRCKDCRDKKRREKQQQKNQY